VIEHTMGAIGMIVAGVILAVGIGLSAWKGEFNPNHNPCDKNCCNPDHWSQEERLKLSSEQYLIMKNNCEKGKVVE